MLKGPLWIILHRDITQFGPILLSVTCNDIVVRPCVVHPNLRHEYASSFSLFSKPSDAPFSSSQHELVVLFIKPGIIEEND
jgi:hypothetical protein